MIELPETALVGRGAVRAYLGVSEATLRKLHEAGSLRVRVPPGCARGKYARSEVLAFAGNVPERKEIGKEVDHAT
jgi:hypothetical protein